MLWKKHSAKKRWLSLKKWIPVAIVFVLLIAAIYVPLSLSSPNIDAPATDVPPLSSEPVLSQTGQEDSNTPSTKPNDQDVIPPPENSTFEIHFIDVGQADAALVLCDGEAMLIDGGNVADPFFVPPV